MPRLQAASLNSLKLAPVGPGVALANQVDFTPQGIKDAINGDESKGIKLGALASAPTFNASPEFQDLTENIVGLNAAFKGAQVLQRTDVTIDVEIVELSVRNLKYIFPSMQSVDFLSSVHARLTVGTGNSQFNVVSQTPGVIGNSTSLVISAPSGSSTSVSVAGSVITVAPKTAETANGAIAAINANAAAFALVQAGLSSTSNGTGAVATLVSTPLAGGTAGSKIGARLNSTGFAADSNYLSNLTLALEGKNQDVLVIYKVANAFSNDDFEYAADDDGNLSSISATFMGHIGDANYDPTTGSYLPPFDIFVFDPV